MTEHELTKRLLEVRADLGSLHLRDRAWFRPRSERRRLKGLRATKRLRKGAPRW